MKFSIIIPVFNAVHYIEDCIRSILDQSYSNYEIIVVDGGSKDGTVDIIKKYSQHFYYWESKSDGGQSYAINKGLRKTTGDIYSWINADERYLPNTLQKVGKHFNSPDVELVHGYTLITNDDENRSFIRKPSSVNPKIQTLFIGEPLQTDATFWSADLSKRVGLLDEENFPRLSMDVDWTLRLAFECRGWSIVKAPLCRRIDRRDASTNSTPYKVIKRNRIFIMTRFLKKKFMIPVKLSQCLYPAISKLYRSMNSQWNENLKNVSEFNAE